MSKFKLHKTLFWFYTSLLIMALPVLFRIYYHYFKGVIDIYDVKDVVWGCLGLCLANYNLVAYTHSKKHDSVKNMIFAASAILACCLCFLIGTIFDAESSKVGELGIIVLNITTYTLTGASIFVSYCANKTALTISLSK